MNVFINVKIKEITIPNNVKEIGENCFSKCTNLTKIELSTSLRKLPNYCFYQFDNLMEFSIPEKWSIHGNKIFNNESHLCSFEIPTAIKIINGKEYKYEELKIYEIPTYVTSLGDYLFSNCKELESITFHSNIKEIGKGCFMNCPLLILENENIIKESQRKQIWLTNEEINQIEYWIEREIQDVIFDSNNDNWYQSTSEFDSTIFGKEKLLFLIEDSNKNVFGCYIKSKIDKYYDMNDSYGTGIKDRKSFIFSLRNNGRSKEMIKIDMNKESMNIAFTLYKKEHRMLFAIGEGNDICIMKENNKNKCYCQPKSFNYSKGKENVLTGKIGMFNSFQVKRILVIQMEED